MLLIKLLIFALIRSNVMPSTVLLWIVVCCACWYIRIWQSKIDYSVIRNEVTIEEMIHAYTRWSNISVALMKYLLILSQKCFYPRNEKWLPITHMIMDYVNKSWAQAHHTYTDIRVHSTVNLLIKWNIFIFRANVCN